MKKICTSKPKWTGIPCSIRKGFNVHKFADCPSHPFSDCKSGQHGDHHHVKHRSYFDCMPGVPGVGLTLEEQDGAMEDGDGL